MLPRQPTGSGSEDFLCGFTGLQSCVSQPCLALGVGKGIKNSAEGLPLQDGVPAAGKVRLAGPHPVHSQLHPAARHKASAPHPPVLSHHLQGDHSRQAPPPYLQAFHPESENPAPQSAPQCRSRLRIFVVRGARDRECTNNRRQAPQPISARSAFAETARM